MVRFLRTCVLALAIFAGESLSADGYSIGRDPSWAPLQVDTFQDPLNAFTNALTQAIAKKEGMFLRLFDVSTINLFYNLDSREVDAILSSLPPSDVTQDRYSFSDPLLMLGPVLVVRENSPATSLADLGGKIVAVNQFDNSVLVVQDYPTIVIRYYKNMPNALDDLSNSKVDGVLLATLEAHALIPARYQDEVKIVSGPLTDRAIRLLTLEGENEGLITKFNKGLSALEKESLYTSLRHLYNIK
ncbi:MAG: L-cystine-binding protein FliY [Chlamydiae bacterium]|nr:L-cystine-binding protein FliY [Chlamydiota bacterium]